MLLSAVVLLAAVLRLALMGPYYGWEESDYGNLAMVRGVLESGFRHYDMNHLPLYYGVSAAVMAVVGDAVLAATGVSFVSGLFVVALSVVLADRVAGRRASWVVGLIVAVQPELSLYSATSLREPLYAALVLGALLALTRERLWVASLLSGLAFLTRMDALLILGPVLALHALGRGPRGLRLLHALGPLLGGVVLWSLYCQGMHGTWRFWEHAAAVNIATGGETKTLTSGMGVVLGLLFELLPSRLGWALMLGLPIGLLFTPWRQHSAQRSVSVAALLLLGFWLGIGLTAQHSPEHNLYWKWLYGVLPPLILLGVAGLERVGDRLQRIGGTPLVALGVVLALGQGAFAMLSETRRQIALSQELYKPQVELGRWLEGELEPGDRVLVDNIPGVWLDRRPHSFTLESWFDVPVQPGDRAGFAHYLARGEIRYVLWFREQWTQAPVIAPYLEDPVVHHLGQVKLVPLQEEPSYGWVFYRVEAP